MRRIKVFLTASFTVAVMALMPLAGAYAAEPLPEGAYDLSIDGHEWTVTVDEEGRPDLSSEDPDLSVTFQYDEEGRVLDEMVVETPDGVYVVEVDVEDGLYTQTVTPQVDDEVGDDESEEPAGDDESEEPEGDDESEEAVADVDDEDDEDEAEDGAHGELVSTVAQCAPNGRLAREMGWPNHGAIVSMVARGEPTDIEVTDPETGEVTVFEADLTTLEGAEAFCAAVEEAEAAMEAQLAEAKAEAKAERDAAKAERDAAKAERDAARAEAKAERDAARAEAGHGKKGD